MRHCVTQTVREIIMFKTNMKSLTRSIIIAGSFFLASCQSSQQLMQPVAAGKEAIKKETIATIPVADTLQTPADIIAVNSVKKRGFLGAASKMIQVKYSSMLGVVPDAIGNFPLYSFIDDWYGTRYRLGGNDKHGIDCSAFVQRLYENVFCTSLVRTAMEQFSSCRMVFNTDSLKEGDLVFFKRGSRISHVGIYLVNNFFVHASSSRGVMISSLGDDYWSRLYAGAGKISEPMNTF